jgi:hypothetical protein
MKRALALSAALVVFMAGSAADAEMFAFGPKTESEVGYFLPTLSAALGIDLLPEKSSYGSFWLGASHYPLRQPWAPFYSIGGELDLRSVKRGDDTNTIATFGPQIRGGVSYVDKEHPYLPIFHAYLFTGYRAPSGLDDGAFRVGVGVSSPGLGLGLLSRGLPVPWMFEGALDVTGDDFRAGFRIGISY